MVRAAVALIGALVVWPGTALAQQPCTGDARHVVNEVYRVMLERSADRGSDVMVEQLRNGEVTVREIVRMVARSSEHRQRFLDTASDEDARRAVDNLYRHILGRGADQGGLRSHVEALKAYGMDRVIDTLIDSTEYQERFGDNGVPGTNLQYCGSRTQVGTTGTIGSNMRFASMDANRDGRVTASEWKGTRQSFRLNDWNSDGVLSGDEVRVGASRYTLGPTDSADDQVQDFDALDINGDRRVDRSEWQDSVDAFDWLDRNDDNILTRREVEGNQRNANRAARDRFSVLDSNNDGRLTADEWEGTRRAFEQQDINNDGVVTRREFNGRVAP